VTQRLLRYGLSTYAQLSHNYRHEKAARHALEIYSADTICSFIPKNACSTLRYSIALANGLIEDNEDFNWIHKNNLTFNPCLRSLIKARYTFTILRCPFRRLASVFMDKIVTLDYHTMNTFLRLNKHSSLLRLNKNRLRKRLGLEQKSVFGISTPSRFTFEKFVRFLASHKHHIYANHHWAPQVSMLVYKDYDDWFRVEKLSEAAYYLKEKINFDLVDTRKLSGHSTLSLIKEDMDASSLSISQLAIMKSSGFIPSYKSLFSSDTVAIVSMLYKEDIMLYSYVFGSEALLF
jgi:hypothetical protein